MLWHCNFFYQFTFIIYMKKKKKTQSGLPWKTEGLSCHHGIRALLFAPVFLRDGYLSSSYASAFQYLLPTMMPYKTTLYMSLSRPLLCRMFSLLFCFVFCSNWDGWLLKPIEPHIYRVSTFNKITRTRLRIFSSLDFVSF